ncbi:MAG: polymer-forming cytoskeletal protein [Alphaproteobacteria bacterium]
MKKLKKVLYVKMARKLNKNNSISSVPSIISENTSLSGDLSSNGTIHIDGHVEGDVSCEELVIGIKGSVTGSVNVTNLHLYGTLQGKAKVETLFVSKSAKLIGEAVHTTIAIEPGAYIDGRCIKAGGPIPAEASKPDLMLVDGTKKAK